MPDKSDSRNADGPAADAVPIDQVMPSDRAAASERAIGQSDSALDRRAGMRRRHRTFADELRELWRASARTAWTAPPAWWTPAIDAVIRAVADGRDPAVAVTQLGRERAAARIGIAQTVDDLNVFYRLCGGSVAPPPVVRAVVAGWQAGADARPGPGPPPGWRGPHRPDSPEPCPASGGVMVR